MSEKMMFESKGLNKVTKLIICIVCITIGIIAALFLFVRSLKKTYLTGRYDYILMDSARTKLLIIGLVLLAIVILLINILIALNKSEIKIYEQHIEFKTIMHFSEILGMSSLTNTVVKFSDIKNVSCTKKNGTTIIDVNGKKIMIFCEGCEEIEKIIKEKLLK